MLNKQIDELTKIAFDADVKVLAHELAEGCHGAIVGEVATLLGLGHPFVERVIGGHEVRD